MAYIVFLLVIYIVYLALFIFSGAMWYMMFTDGGRMVSGAGVGQTDLVVMIIIPIVFVCILGFLHKEINSSFMSASRVVWLWHRILLLGLPVFFLVQTGWVAIIEGFPMGFDWKERLWVLFGGELFLAAPALVTSFVRVLKEGPEKVEF